MTLKQWMDNGWLRPHKTSAEEIENLFMIIDRDLKDVEGGITFNTWKREKCRCGISGFMPVEKKYRGI